MHVDVGGEGVPVPRLDPGPGHQQRDVAEQVVDGGHRLAERVVALAEVVPVVGGDDEGGVVPQVVAVEGVEYPAEPVVDHGELGAVVGSHLGGLAFGEDALGDGVDGVRRPDRERLVTLVVVPVGPRFGGVERLVGVELVDEQEEPVVVAGPGRAGVAVQPVGGGGHGAGAGVVGLLPEVGAGGVVAAVEHAGGCRQGGCADPAGVVPQPPGVALVAPHVLPHAEVGVVVLAAGLEQVWVVGDDAGGHAVHAHLACDVGFPDFDAAPRPPQEVPGAAEDVVAGRHARQRRRVVPVEAQRPGGQSVEVGGVELVAAVAAEHAPVQAVEQHHHGVAGPRSLDVRHQRGCFERQAAGKTRGRVGGAGHARCWHGRRRASQTGRPARPATPSGWSG